MYQEVVLFRHRYHKLSIVIVLLSTQIEKLNSTQPKFPAHDEMLQPVFCQTRGQYKKFMKQKHRKGESMELIEACFNYDWSSSYTLSAEGTGSEVWSKQMGFCHMIISCHERLFGDNLSKEKTFSFEF